MIEQLIGQGYLEREGEYSTLYLNERSREILRGEADIKLAKPKSQTFTIISFSLIFKFSFVFKLFVSKFSVLIKQTRIFSTFKSR